MRKPVTVIMTLALVLSAVVPAPLPVSPPIASAAAPTPPRTPVWDSAIESAVAVEQALPSPPSPDDAHRKIEEARARSAMEKVLEKHLDYWGPRYRVEPVQVSVDREWAHGVALWRGEFQPAEGPIHVLARRGESGSWQALMPSAEGLYLRWVDEVPESLVPPDVRDELIRRASSRRVTEQQVTDRVLPSPWIASSITDEKWAYSVAPLDGWTVAINTIDHPLEFAHRVSLVGPKTEMVRVLAWPKSPDRTIQEWLSDINIFPRNECADVSRGVESMVSGHHALIILSNCCADPVIYVLVDALDRMILVEYSEDDALTSSSYEAFSSVLETIAINRTAVLEGSSVQTEDDHALIRADELQSVLSTCTYADVSEGCCGYPEILRWQCSKDSSGHRGNCTYWASYKRRDIGDTIAQIAPLGEGHAGHWAYWAYEAGCDVDRNPQPGSIMVMEVGHVAYVRSTSGDYLEVTEMNWCGSCLDPERNETYASSDKWFIHSCCPAPNLVSPAWGYVHPDSTVTFRWDPVDCPGQNGYLLRIGTSPDGSDVVSDRLSLGIQTNVTISSQWHNRHLYWSVRANASGAPWSGSRRFRIELGSGDDCPLFSKGDANCDGCVDELDYVVWWKSYEKDVRADFNGDGITDDLDYVIWWKNFGEGCQGG